MPMISFRFAYFIQVTIAVQELRDPDVIPPYNKTLVDKCAQQINKLHNENISMLME